MPLEESCRGLIGSRIYCLPVDGYGWSAFVNGTDPPIETPPRFSATIATFYSHHDGIRVGIAKIDEPVEGLLGNWMAFSVRDGYLAEDTEGKMFFNFSTKLGKYNIHIGTIEPVVAISFSKPIVEWVNMGTGTYFSGIGYLADRDYRLDTIFKT